MKNPILKLCAASIVAASACFANVQAAQLQVMTSGGFTAAYKLLGPRFAAHTGHTLETTLGPSMGKSPEAIPNRLARGEPADVVIMVGYALDELITQGRVLPGSRVELADSRIGEIDRLFGQRKRCLCRAGVVQEAWHRGPGQVEGEDDSAGSGGVGRGQR